VQTGTLGWEWVGHALWRVDGLGKGREPRSWSQLRGKSGNSPPPQSGPPLPAPSSCQNSAHFLCSYWDSHLGHSIHEIHLSLSLSFCVLFTNCRLHIIMVTLLVKVSLSWLNSFLVFTIILCHWFNEFLFLKEMSVSNRGCLFRATRVVFLSRLFISRDPCCLFVALWTFDFGYYLPLANAKNRLNVLW